MQARLPDSTTYPQVLRAQLGLHSPLQKHIDYCRFSESPMWSAQRQYFQVQGVNPWRTETIPFYATSNPGFARAYAKIVVEYWQDAMAIGLVDINRVLPIVEMGSGSGTFTFYFLQALEQELELSPISAAKWQLVCTDIAEVNGRFIAHHPKLKPYVDAHKMVVGCFDVETQSTIFLSDGETLTTFSNPCVAIANYLFDSLTQDLFHLDYGRLYEAQVGLKFPPNPGEDDSKSRGDSTTADGVNPLIQKQFEAENPFNNMEVEYRWQPLDSPYWLADDIKQQVEAYLSDFDSNALLYPTGAIQCISHLKEMAKNGLLLLCADKGFYTEQDARLQPIPRPSIQGSFSFPVNFNALTRYCETQGGLSWCAKNREDGLVYSAMIFGDKIEQCGNTQSAIFQNFVQTSPDYLITIARRLCDQASGEVPVSNLALDEMLAYLQLFDYCPKVLEIFLPSLLRQADQLTEASCKIWAQSLEKIWRKTYFLGGDTRWLFEFGALALDLNAWDVAREIYLELLQHCGGGPAAYYNLALANTHLAQWSGAVESIDSAIHLLSFNGMASSAEESLLQSSVKLKEYCNTRYQALLMAIKSHPDLGSAITFANASGAADAGYFLTPLDVHFSLDILHQCRDRNIGVLTRLPDFDTLEQVELWIAQHNQYGNKHIYCVIHRTKGFVGLAGVHQAGDAGYFFFCIGTDYQNQGMGYQALELIKAQSLGLGMATLFSGVYKDNHRSHAVLAKHHFQLLDAAAEQPDSELDFYCLDLKAATPPKLQSAPSVGLQTVVTEMGIDSGDKTLRLAALLTEINSPITLIKP